jgi:calcineurin-like phosphoesterase family protein
VWHLGDVTMLRNKQIHSIDHSIMARLQGHKRLIFGNHDHGDPKWYAQWFEKLRGSHRIDRILLFSHIPVHPDSLPANCFNIHGHTHAQPSSLPYLNISVEQTEYRPISLEEIKQRLLLR